jgi:hypothetical protein
MTTLHQFDGLGNRKQLMAMLERLGRGVSEEEACARRGEFIRGLMLTAPVPMAHGGEAPPMPAAAAYCAVVGLAQTMGVDIEEVAKQLDEKLRRM